MIIKERKEVPDMQKRKRKRKRILIGLISIISAAGIITFVFLFRMRPVIIRNAESVGKSILLNAANEALLECFNETEYDDIVTLSTDSEGRVTGIQTDAAKINLLKSSIALKISEIVASKQSYNTYIPLGTFLGSEFTSGVGPKICFSMQITTYSVVDIRFEFVEAGLNQVAHRISLSVNMSGRLVMTGVSDSFTAETNAILAETVIVGLTPDAYTQVIESGDSDIAEDINDYGATTE